jgi:hypothetical protein
MGGGCLRRRSPSRRVRASRSGARSDPGAPGSHPPRPPAALVAVPLHLAAVSSHSGCVRDKGREQPGLAGEQTRKAFADPQDRSSGGDREGGRSLCPSGQ